MILGEARAHWARIKDRPLDLDKIGAELKVEDAQTNFLAALSWVWDAQQRDPKAFFLILPTYRGKRVLTDARWDHASAR